MSELTDRKMPLEEMPFRISYRNELLSLILLVRPKGNTPRKNYRWPPAENQAQFFRCSFGAVLRFQQTRRESPAGNDSELAGMMGNAPAHYEGIKTFSETDQTDDLKAIRVLLRWRNPPWKSDCCR